MPPIEHRWVIVTDPIEGEDAQGLLEAAKEEGFRARLIDVVDVARRRRPYGKELADATGLILWLHGPYWNMTLLEAIGSLKALKRGAIIIAVRSSRYERLKPWFDDIGIEVYFAPVELDPQGQYVVSDSFSIEAVLEIMRRVSVPPDTGNPTSTD